MADPNSTSGDVTSSAVVSVEQYSSEFLLFVDDPPIALGGSSFSTNANSLGQFADPTDVRIELTGTFMVTPTTPTFRFLAQLSTSTTIGVSSPGDVRVSEVDFGNSAHLSMILPAGVPWTSESGVFLQGVPEPGTGALLGAGMLCLGIVRPVRGRTRPPIIAGVRPAIQRSIDGQNEI